MSDGRSLELSASQWGSRLVGRLFFLRADTSGHPIVRLQFNSPTPVACSLRPPSLASYFTVGELAVLRIIADAVAANGQCVKSIAEI
jgi:hypothetical protein